VPLRSAGDVAAAEPDRALIAGLPQPSGTFNLYLFALGRDGRSVHARSLPTHPYEAEDPATGSAAGPLGVYLAQQREAGMPGRLRIVQGEEIGRPSELFADVTEDGDSFEVWVQGSVRIVGRGVFQL